MNLLEATISNGAVEVAPGVRIPLRTDAAVADGKFLVGIRPEDVLLCGPGEPAATAEVIRDVPLGHYRELTVQVGPAQIRVFGSSAAQPDSDITGVAFRRIVTFPSETSPETSEGDNE